MGFQVKIKNTNQSLQGVTNINELPAKYIKAIIYGEPGAGKTFMMGSANDHPETANIIVGDIDGGTATLEGMNIDYQELTTGESIMGFYEFLNSYCYYRDIYLDPEGDDASKLKAKGQIAMLMGITTKEEFADFEVPIWKTVALDTLTEAQKTNMESIMSEVAKTRPNQDPDVPSVREWGVSGNQMRKYIKLFRSLPMHVFFLMHVTTNKDELLGSITYAPAIPGKLSQEIPGYVDIVGYLQSSVDEDGDFVNNLYTMPFGQHKMLKDRTGSLGKGLHMPTLGKIYDIINDGRQAKLDAYLGKTTSENLTVKQVKEAPKKAAKKEPAKEEVLDKDAPL